jgi:cell division protein FtsB
MDNYLEKTLYHSFLRVAVVVMALILVFDSGLLNKSTANVSDIVQANMANVVGVKVGVAPNELNQLTSRITELETELQAKERLISVNLERNNPSNEIDKSTLVLSIILFIMLVLIVLNYALDYLRVRERKDEYENNNAKLA